MTGTLIGLYGVGGFGREVMPLLCGHRQQNTVVCFIETQPSRRDYQGIPVTSEQEFLEYQGPRYFNVAIANSRARQDIADRCMQAGAMPMDIVSPQSSIYATAQTAPGLIACANTMITDSATVGKFFHLNIFSYVAHDCRIGDWVTFAPGVHCNGNVTIGDHAYVGAGAAIRQGITVGAGAVIGMGAVVVRDVAPNTTVVGNPARVLRS